MTRRHSPGGPPRGHPPARDSDPIDDQSGGPWKVRHQEALLDHAIEETFPASDPISPMVVN